MLKPFFTYQKTIVIVFVLITQLMNAQFINDRYGFLTGSAEVGWNAIENDSGYLMVGGTIPGNSEIGIVQTNFNGNVLFQKTYGKSGVSYFPGFQGSLTKLNNGGYAMYGGLSTPINSESVGVLFRFDEIGDTLWTKTYGDSLAFQTGRHMRQTLDGGFILLGDNGGSSARNWVVKTDSLGVIEWEQTYGGPNSEIPVHIATCMDGGYIFCGFTYSLGPGIPATSNIRITKIDSLGNVVFTKVFGESDEDDVGSISQTQDGGYIFGGGLKAVADGYRRPYAIRLDSLGDTLWTSQFTPLTGFTPYGYFNKILELPDGSFIGTGFEYYTDSVVIARYHGLIIKMDANGNKLWHKEYNLLNGSGSDHYLKDIRPTSDGGFICAGNIAPAFPDTGSQDMWLLKIDSNGCVDTTCTLISDIPQNKILEGGGLLIYPNPSNGLFTVQLPKGSIEGNFRLIDITGKQVFQQSIKSSSTQVDVGKLSKGIYFYHYREKKNAISYSGKLIVN
jgi:Secretion system C-terminal sorting domain